LDYTPSPSYQDSPIYLKDKRIDRLKIITESPIGNEDEVYYNSLGTYALVIDAETFYEKKDYQKALALFQKAQKRSDGRLMRTYAGLYGTYVKLGQKDKATKAFEQLLIMSLSENNKLNIKFLFDVNSSEFIDDVGLRKEYDSWLQMIAQYFQKNNQCFQIVGHCSRTGTVAYNDKLSLSRALTVQKLMQTYLPTIMQRTTVVGKGFRENLVGIGTDDVRDAIDRRVEILVVDCSQ
jgi:outer membrane protein OmpA-like peptidoglycan-associated protein